MRAATRSALRAAGLDPEAVAALVRAALDEDLGPDGDLTSRATVGADAALAVRYVPHQDGVAAGLPVLAAVVDVATGDAGRLRLHVADGAPLRAGDTLAELTAPARDVLALERTSLNLLGRLCGIAGLTARWVAAVDGTGARIRDTRKTTPLLRALEKYAVRCGGGVNHRAGLYDAVLIKDNHVAAAGGVGPALRAARGAAAGLAPGVVVQVEVDTLDQLDEALDAGAEQILLDNFDTERLREAVRRVRARRPEVLLEASGGLTLARAREVALTGVDFLAVGALTHSAPTLDIGLDAADGLDARR